MHLDSSSATAMFSVEWMDSLVQQQLSAAKGLATLYFCATIFLWC
jgi:hypothetical protein